LKKLISKGEKDFLGFEGRIEIKSEWGKWASLNREQIMNGMISNNLALPSN
jgi:hypothetical protein